MVMNLSPTFNDDWLTVLKRVILAVPLTLKSPCIKAALAVKFVVCKLVKPVTLVSNERVTLPLEPPPVKFVPALTSVISPPPPPPEAVPATQLVPSYTSTLPLAGATGGVAIPFVEKPSLKLISTYSC